MIAPNPAATTPRISESIPCPDMPAGMLSARPRTPTMQIAVCARRGRDTVPSSGRGPRQKLAHRSPHLAVVHHERMGRLQLDERRP
jgi:hypothetical protein